MSEIADGQMFGAWKVLRRASDGRYLCLCTSCGNTQKRVKRHDLVAGKSLQCRSCSHSVKRAHGAEHDYPSEYQSWQSMIARCTNPANKDYHKYGAKGITVDPMWLMSFEVFLMQMGKKPTPEHTIDRIDGTKGYTKSNCRWLTRDEQNRNLKSNITLTLDGETKTVAEWARDPRAKVTEYTMYKRLKRGWTDAQEVICKPSRQGSKTKEQQSEGSETGEGSGQEAE